MAASALRGRTICRRVLAAWRARPARFRSSASPKSSAKPESPRISNGRKERDHALFVGYAPIKDPRYAVAVVVEHGGSGSSMAAPIAKAALKRALETEGKA